VSTTIAYLPTLNAKFVTDYVEFCAGRWGVDPEEALKFLNVQNWAAGKDDYEPSLAEQAAWDAAKLEIGRELGNLDHSPTWEELNAITTTAMAPAMRRTRLHIVPPRS
jgi:hypothetical protein